MSAKAYKAAGVDLEAADSIKENIVAFASLTHGPDVLRMETRSLVYIAFRATKNQY